MTTETIEQLEAKEHESYLQFAALQVAYLTKLEELERQWMAAMNAVNAERTRLECERMRQEIRQQIINEGK